MVTTRNGIMVTTRKVYTFVHVVALRNAGRKIEKRRRRIVKGKERGGLVNKKRREEIE